MKSEIKDDRGWITKIRRSLPRKPAKYLRNVALWVFAILPNGFKYKIIAAYQRRRYPYKLLEEGDRIVQIGAPRDILKGGRSRAIHFARAVGSKGRVLIVEPDPASVEALQRFVSKQGLSERVIVLNCAVWRDERTLKFSVHNSHPAANRVEENVDRDFEQQSISSEDEIIEIKSTTLGGLLLQYDFERPKLISITTNGAEREILSGLWPAGEKFTPKFISLGPPNDANVAVMREHGYRWIAWDDRGQLFEQDARTADRNSIHAE